MKKMTDKGKKKLYESKNRTRSEETVNSQESVKLDMKEGEGQRLEGFMKKLG